MKRTGIRRTSIAVVAVLLLAGCSKKESSVSSVVSEEPEVKETVWQVEPTLKFSSVKPLEGLRSDMYYFNSADGRSQTVLSEPEAVGYPVEWISAGYRPDVVVVTSSSMHGIYDYYGNEVYPISVRVKTTPFSKGITSAYYLPENGESEKVFGYADTARGAAYIFNKDFTEVKEIAYDEFVSDPLKNFEGVASFALLDGQFGVLYRQRTADGQISAAQAFENYNGTLNRQVIAQVIDRSYAVTGRNIIDINGKWFGPVVNGRGSYQSGTYVNGFYLAGTANEKAFINAEEARQISLDYHDAYYFEDGYAPVKKYGKWGFIDEEGKEVTDFIFDHATPLYNGLTYVEKDGKWGVLKLSQSLQEGKDITLATCYNGETDENRIGTIKVVVSNLYFRDNPSTGGSSTGISREGISYPVYETQEADGYTWYRIDQGNWLASDGSWVEYSAD